ncbi:transcriptional regulator [Escherichia coli]|nr:transcriptional regulator [Escherichia coli]KJW40846.1 transcriptional regulator [Escherichia coli]KJY11238.1 transcriptional regulator [Escherichia coli]
MSPLRYQKWLRLNEVRRPMLNEHYDVTTAAYAVGYESYPISVGNIRGCLESHPREIFPLILLTHGECIRCKLRVPPTLFPL